jgi:hypothetical protein|tara:strand:+ start:2291 stop:2485 length:195 start_codon:yes stop_codon:yes gene_type:complete
MPVQKCSLGGKPRYRRRKGVGCYACTPDGKKGEVRSEIFATKRSVTTKFSGFEEKFLAFVKQEM